MIAEKAASIKVVDPEVIDLISRGSSELGVTAETFVAEAVRAAYARYRKDRMRVAMGKLDGSLASSVSLLTGLSRERLDELGGFVE
jgi:hypothetical protein